ncbi:MAG: pitrilysin family protein [Candidatus Sericytochromatia bacterium]|nr:pitrilysin family protein [Candidatus Sericytochromatia bacterium]
MQDASAKDSKPGLGTMSSGRPRQIDPSVSRLPGGLTVITLPMSGQEAVAISAWVHVGSRHEDPLQAGISHDLEHLLSRGTTRRGELEDRLEIFATGGLHGADTFYDRTTYHAVVPATAFASAFDALADSLRNPTFPEEGIAKERKVVGEEISRMVDRPETAAWMATWGLAFGRHPYARPVIGDFVHLRGLQRDDFVAHHRRWYRPDHMVLAVAGAITHEQVMTEAARQFGAPASGSAEPSARVAGNATWAFRGLQRLRQVKEVPHPSLDLAFVVPGRRHPDRWALEILARLLGGDGASRLWQAAVAGERSGATSVQAGLQLLEEHGVLWCSARPKSVTAAGALETDLVRVVRVVRDEAPSAVEVASIREARIREARMMRETPLGVARWLGEAAVLGDLEATLGEEAGLAAVTSEDVRRVARRYLRTDNMTVVLTVPPGVVTDGSEVEAWAGTAKELAALSEGATTEASAASLWAEARPWTHPTPRTVAPSGDKVEGSVTIQRHVLPNGLVVLHEHRPAAGISGLALQVRGGAAEDPEDAPGAMALLSEALQEGTQKRDQQALAAAFRRLGNAWSVGVDREALGLSASVLREDLPAALDVALELLSRPLLDDAGVNRARERLRARQEREREDPAIQAGQALAETVWGKAGYGRPVTGLVEALPLLTPSRLKQLHLRRVRPEAGVLSLVDARSWAELKPLLAGFASWRPSEEEASGSVVSIVPPPVPAAPLAPALVKRRTLHVPMERQQVHVAVGFPMPPAGHPDSLALRVLVGGLAFDSFVDLVYRKPLAYSTGGQALLLERGGLGMLTVATRPEAVDEAVQELVGRWRTAAGRGLSAPSLKRAEARVAGGLALRDQQAAQAAVARATWWRRGLGEDEGASVRSGLQRLDAATIERVARTWLVPARMVVVVAGPKAPSRGR